MYLRRMHVDRFGILQEQSVAGISPGLSVFLGQNEAGKSTCLRFLQAMLFGYRRGGRNLDPMPTRSTKFASGGSLFLQTERQGLLILTRRPGARGGELSLTCSPGGEAPPLSAASGDTGGNGSTGGVTAQTAFALAGTALDERDLQNLLSGMTADVFDSIFAFSLKQLMELSALKGDSVRHALHGAAFGTGMQSPGQVLKNLEDRMSALLKRDVASASAPVNNSLRELAAVRAELRARGPDLQHYEQLHQRLEDLEQAIAGQMEQRDTLTIALRKVERRLSVWQQWEEVRRLRTELEALGLNAASASPEHSFAPDALQRFESLLVQQEERLFALRGVEANLAGLERECEQLRPFPVLTAMFSSVQALREQKDQRRHEAQALTVLQGEMERLHAEQLQTLDALGHGWDIGTVLDFDSSVASFDVIRTASERLERAKLYYEQAGQAVIRHKAEHAETAAQVRSTELALTELEAKYRDTNASVQGAVCCESVQHGGFGDDRVSFFPERMQRLRHLERLMREHYSLEAELAKLLASREAEQLRGAARQADLWSSLARKGLSVFLASILVVVCGLGLTGYGVFIRDLPMAVEGGVLSLLGVAVLAMTLRAAWLDLKEHRANLAILRGRLDGCIARKETVEGALQPLIAALRPWFFAFYSSSAAGERQAARVDTGLVFPCGGVVDGGSTVMPVGAGLEEAREPALGATPGSSSPVFALPDETGIALALRAVEEDSRREQALRSQLTERLARAERAGEALLAAEEAARTAETGLCRARQQWQQWLEDKKLRSDLSPQGAGETLQLIREAAKRHSALAQLEGQRAVMERTLAAFIDSIKDTAREGMEAGELRVTMPLLDERPDNKGGKALSTVLQKSLQMLDLLGEAVEHASRESVLHAQKKEQLDDENHALRQRTEAYALTRDQVAGLLASTGCADAETFRTAYSRWNRIEGIRAEERNLLSGIRTLAAEEGARMEDVLASLEHTTFDGLEEEQLALGSELETLADVIGTRTEERGQLRERQSALAADSSGSLLRGREAALCEDLHRYSREWSVLALARQLLLEAKSRYEKEGREGVLRFASDMFRDITDGEYSGIIASLEGENFLALHHSGEPRDPEKDLSQGTREQLYLALRLAYVKNHARSAEALPVILDETLVNFDLPRIRNTARILAGFARENQILAFTCHPWLAEILLEEAGQAGSSAPEPASFLIARGVITPQSV